MKQSNRITKKKVLEVISSIVDPDLGFGIVALGLVYDVHVHRGEVVVDMTYTQEGQVLYDAVEETLRHLDGVSSARVHLISDPPWSAERIDPRIRPELGAC